ncbi:C4-dicarboxylate TRAP transporter substrate-binding protein [uncultured Maritimibacter sp.]|jgi:TRAP-type C4-dicarboxylate transport system substrate-binding protein|uniref:C4-dicarboxylate TRAP transporter substrate-binding protein n=1 Tax=uncultured Maritimibacter sp. TaxID=991866 RepID=UPI000AC852F8|nr:C4-dicarboxylate TRAP transporter substrate-binding protein [uncultured Maritimibacter sp.]
MKNATPLSLVLALPVLATPALAAETIRMTIAAGLPVHSTGVSYLENLLIPEVDRRLAETGDYQIEWTKGWGGTIAGQFDMFEAVEDGIVDIAYVNTLFEGAKLPLEQITFVTPFGSTDLKQTMATFDKVREEIPELDEQFLKHNQRRLAISGLVNYHMLSTFEINTLDDLEGRKFGAPGLAANWLEGTGATPVSGSLSEYYNSLKTGVYDGVLMFESGIPSFKFYEVAPIITRVGFGSQLTTNITINEDKWQSLPPEVQEILMEVAADYETQLVDATVERAATGLQTAVENGATINDMPTGEIAALAAALPNIAQLWVTTTDEKGLPGTRMLEAWMQASRDAGVTFARDWDKE